MGAEEPEKTKSGSSAKRRLPTRFVRLIGTFLVVLAIPVGGYGLYVVNQLNEVEAQNLRTLAKAAGAIQALVDNFTTNIENLARNPDYACDFQRRQTRLRLQEPGTCEALNGRESLDPNPDVKIAPADGQLQLSVDLEPKQTTDSESQPPEDSPPDQSTDSQLQSPEKSPPDQPASDPKDKMIWSVRFDQVLAEIPFGDGLDVLLVADDGGHVVTQYPDPSVRQPGNTSPGEYANFGDRLMSERGVRINDLKQLETIGDVQENLLELGYGTSIRTVTVAGTGYTMLCQPLILNGLEVVDNGNPLSNWILCGLVEEGRALSDALEVAPFLTVFLFSLFFFGLFLWPIAKILTMSPRERFRFADVYLLLLGSWGALMLATILVVTIDTYESVSDAASDGLKQLAHDIEGNLASELVALSDQLQAYDMQFNENLITWVETSQTDAVSLPPGSDELPEPFDDQTRLLDETLPAVPGNASGTYPFFSSFFWAEPCSGQQIAKGASRHRNTPKVDVGGRDYYRKVQASDLWQLPGRAKNGVTARYYLQTFRSLTTGEFFAALSMSSRLGWQSTGSDGSDDLAPSSSSTTLQTFWAKADGDDGRYEKLRSEYGRCGSVPIVASVMLSSLVSTTGPVLAPGVGFAIIDDDGNVILHSDERRAQFENLYEELSDGDRLQAIVEVGTGSTLNSNYRARPHQLFVRRMQQLPWTVVTFLDNEILRTSYLEALMHSVMLMLVHLVLYFFASLLFLVWQGRSSPTWMWPYISERPNDYRWLVWMLLVLILGATLVMNMLQGTVLLLVCLCLPVIPIAAVAAGPEIVKLGRDGAFVSVITVAFPPLAAVFMVWVAPELPARIMEGGFNFWLAGATVVLWLLGAVFAVYRHFLEPSSSVSASERRASLLAYTSVAVLMWITIAVLPAYGYASHAVTDQLRVLLKFENQFTVRRIFTRDAVISESYLDVDIKPEYLKERLALGQKDIYRFSLFAHPAQSDPARADTNAVLYDTRYKSSPLRSVFPWNSVAGSMPIYNETSRALRYYQQLSDEEEKMWTAHGDGVVTFVGSDPAKGSFIEIDSRLAVRFPMLGTTTLIAALLGLLGIIAWARYGARIIFFGNLPPVNASCDIADTHTARDLLHELPHDRTFAVTVSERAYEQFEHAGNHVALQGDLSRVDIENLRIDIPIVCTGFEAAYEAHPATLLMFLSALSNNVGTPVVIVAKKTMLAIFGLDRPTALDEYLEVSVALESGTEPGQAGESFSPRRDLLKGATAEWIRRELDGVADLQDIIRSTAGDLAGRYGSRKEILAHIERLARPFYQCVWNECTPDEQLVLVQLAEEGAVNPKQQSAVQSLLQRRILRKDTELRIMNQSFALFASSVHDPRVVAKFEKSHSGTNWARTQRIIVVGIVLLLIFLVTTQPAAVETLTKYFSGVAASVIALITLANKLGGLKGNTR